MTLRKKLNWILAIPLIGMAVIFLLGIVIFFSFKKNLDIINTWQNDRATMIDADRDAYQAFLGESQAMTELDKAVLEALETDYKENLQQTRDRILLPEENMNQAMLDYQAEFTGQYNNWTGDSRKVLSLALKTADAAALSLELDREIQGSFGRMRDMIDGVGERIDGELSGDLSLDRRLNLERAQSLVLNGDRDAYQALVAQLQVLDSKNYSRVGDLKASYLENAGQTLDRVNAAVAILNDPDFSMQTFTGLYNQWNNSSERLFETIEGIAADLQEMQDSHVLSKEGFNRMRDVINSMGEEQNARVGALEDTIKRRINIFIIAYVFTLIASFSVSFIVVYIFSNRLIDMQLGAEPVILEDISRQIARGDLTLDRRILEEELQGVYKSMIDMKVKLSEIVSNVLAGTEQIASASEELATGNQDLSDRTEQQASALEETSAAIEEMNASVKSNADNTRTADKLSRDAVEKTEEGSSSVEKMILSMNEISESSNRIADIIEVINNIAFQTNLLALNASIEAARAGEQGKGFAVVAVEVRKLAKRSDRAAAEIAEIIKNSNKRVEEGVVVATSAGEMLQEINAAVKKVTNLVAEISSSSQEQLTSVDQIDSTLSNLDENTQKNAAMVEEAASSTEELSAQAQELNSTMQFFTIEKHNRKKLAPPPVEKKQHRIPAPADEKGEEEGVQTSKRTEVTESGKGSYETFTELAGEGDFDEY